MARYSDAELTELKESIDLVALVQSRGIALSKHGSKDLKGLCPFHNDTNPSFIVSSHKNLWNCPACGKGGDVIRFVQEHDGVSFRHAVELLKNGHVIGPSTGSGRARSGQVVKKATVAKLPPPVELNADDQVQLNQVIDYYHQRLLETSPAQAYLKKRGIFNEEAIATFRIGYADRTLGLRLPKKNRKSGKSLRDQLEKVGIYRESGHEHLNGCLVIPVFGSTGDVTEVYGRKLSDKNAHRGSASHLYLPGPHRGIWNRACLESDELILCESLIDALTCWCCGASAEAALCNVTASYGTNGLTEEMVDAFVAHNVRRVRIAYDADRAGDRGAEKAVETLRSHGIETYRVRLPHGLDVNTFVLGQGADGPAALAHVINAAEWRAGTVDAPASIPVSPVRALTNTSDPLAAKKEITKGAEPVCSESIERVHATHGTTEPNGPRLEEVGDYQMLALGQREYRVGGLAKNNSVEVLRVSLRLRYNETFHLDTFDLAQDNHRRRFIERAAEETQLEKALIKRDLGQLLLLLEDAQHNRLHNAKSEETPTVNMSEKERNAALALLTAPDLIERINGAFDDCGLVGEHANRLAAYLACTSRKLDRPLAVIIQSTSAAGKSTLMEAVLAMFPAEERVKYSAMTGQSLFYLGESDLRHKILAIVEEEGAEKASYALKLLQSEGELTIASTGKNPQNGRMETQEYHVEGPVMIFLTTTAIDIDEELQNRCLILTVDESVEQTERIHTLQRQARTLDGLRRRKRKEKTLSLLCNMQRLLEPIDVVNPYAGQLTFTANRTRTRRDHEKYLTLIDAIALLHQYQRPKERVDSDDARPFIRVSVDDIVLANRLAPELLGRSSEDLPPQTRRLYDAVKSLVRERCERDEIAPQHALFSRRDIRQKLGWSVTQVRRQLERLREHDCIVARCGGPGAGFQYELLTGLDEPENDHIGLLDIEKLHVQRAPDRKNAHLTKG